MSVVDVQLTNRKLVDSQEGMTWLQCLLLIALIMIFALVSLPPWFEQRKVTQADVDVEIISEAVKKYHRHTKQYPTNLHDLVLNPGIEGWRYPYLYEVPQTPWKSKYILIPEIYKICLGDNENGVPSKYRLGGISEISRVYLEGRSATQYWWQTGSIN